MAERNRKALILEFLKANGRFATVEQLAGTLYVSPATVRRDLSEMEATHLLRRTRGGAMLMEGGANDDPLDLRENKNVMQKQIIAAQATRHIKDGMTLFLDSSSTVYILARGFDRFSSLRVVTNGIKTALLLSDYKNVQVMCTGGTVRENTKSLAGQSAVDYIVRLNADIAFMSCRGFSIEGGAAEASEEEFYIKRQYLANSRRSFLLCDSAKLNQQFLCRIAPLSRFDEVITERRELNEMIRRSVGPKG